ncbi:hypothetical protein QJS66_20605 [Kocuria rhizophila]|nr:hypothetical protein QJS66_20605 [Kocuria rhizophila]
MIVEGLNALAPAKLDSGNRMALALSDFFDFSILTWTPAPVTSSAGTRERFQALRSSGVRRSATHSTATRTSPTTRHGTWPRNTGHRMNEPTWSNNARPPGAGGLILSKDHDQQDPRWALLRKN